MALYMDSWLGQCPEPLSFAVFVPAWTDSPGLEVGTTDCLSVVSGSPPLLPCSPSEDYLVGFALELDTRSLWQVMAASPYLQALRFVEKGDHTYVPGFQHLPRRGQSRISYARYGRRRSSV